MDISNRLRKEADSIWARIFEHPFVVELYQGNLPLEKFEFYILQDYHYLIAAMRNFSIIASKAPTVAAMREVIDILNLEATSEFDGYEELLERLGYTLTDAAEIDPIPISVSYSSFLLSTSSLKSYAEAVAAVLPCFWSYAELADHHKESIKTNNIQLYKDWGNVYLTDSYLSLVKKIQNLVNKAGEECSYGKLKSVFMAASKYEFMFWEAVYNKQEWPV